MKEHESWDSKRERGSFLALRFAVGLVRLLGHRLGFLVVYPIAIYFFLHARASRPASQDYFRRLASTPEGLAALGHPPNWKDRYLQTLEFSKAIFDRLACWGGGMDRYTFIQGEEHDLTKLCLPGKGLILLGSHLGSFDMLRVLAGQDKFPITIIQYTHNAPAINSFFKDLDPEIDVRVISPDAFSPSVTLEVRACLERGEIVGILADRVGVADSRTGRADFFGKPASFPQGAFYLATLLGAPIIAASAIRTGNATYEVLAKPFYDGTPVPRREREKRISELTEAWAHLLEEHCCRAPHQWYNFFDFWSAENDSDS